MATDQNEIKYGETDMKNEEIIKKIFALFCVIAMWLSLSSPLHSHVGTLRKATIYVEEGETDLNWKITLSFFDLIDFCDIQDANVKSDANSEQSKAIIEANKEKIHQWLTEIIKFRETDASHPIGIFDDPDFELPEEKWKLKRITHYLANLEFDYTINDDPKSSILDKVIITYQTRKEINANGIAFSQHIQSKSFDDDVVCTVSLKTLSGIEQPPRNLEPRKIINIPFDKVLSTWDSMVDYGEMGFSHILGDEVITETPWETFKSLLLRDHLLFLLGLALIHIGYKSLLISVSIFTVAHCLTLLISSFEIFSLEPTVIEPLIAFSIALSGWHAWKTISKHKENAELSTPKYWYVIVLVIGLIHGMGFSFLLKETLQQEKSIASWLFSFNIGIELGQICFLIFCVALLKISTQIGDKFSINFRYALSILLLVVGSYMTVDKFIS